MPSKQCQPVENCPVTHASHVHTPFRRPVVSQNGILGTPFVADPGPVAVRRLKTALPCHGQRMTGLVLL